MKVKHFALLGLAIYVVAFAAGYPIYFGEGTFNEILRVGVYVGSCLSVGTCAILLLATYFKEREERGTDQEA